MSYLNRTLCDVLEEMRACWKTRNFAALLGLIEEAQSMGNRMESALMDKADYDKAREAKEVAEKELAELNVEVKELGERKVELEERCQAIEGHLGTEIKH